MCPALRPRPLCEDYTDTAQANRYSFQSFATSEFEVNSLITTISVVRSVIGAAAQPAGGKIADVFGRLELLVVSIIFYVVGSIIEAASTNLSGFSAGAVFYELGYTMAQLLSTSLTPLSLPVAGLPHLLANHLPAGNSWMLGPDALTIQSRSSLPTSPPCAPASSSPLFPPCPSSSIHGSAHSSCKLLSARTMKSPGSGAGASACGPSSTLVRLSPFLYNIILVYVGLGGPLLLHSRS